MSFESTVDAWVNQRRTRDEERGYRFLHKRVVMAYGIELIVIAASLFGAWYFAKRYGHGDMDTMQVMMLAPLGYAVIEFCRVPLALSVRTQRNWLVMIAALLGLMFAAGVTIKSMSQLGYLMFQPRLEAVNKATRDLDVLTSDRDNFSLKRKAAEASLEGRKHELDNANERVQEATKGLIDRPKPATCVQITYVGRTGQLLKGAKCPTETVAPMLNERAKEAENNRKVALAAFDEAQKELNALDPKAYEDKVTVAEAVKKQAIFNSQLHTFTAMVYGKDPDRVTEGELHWFLRLFVFVPAVCVAFASTLLALTAVERVKATKQLEMPEDAGSFLLGPLANAVIAEANRTVARTAADVLRDAHAAAAKGALAAAKGASPTPPVGDENVVPMGARA